MLNSPAQFYLPPRAACAPALRLGWPPCRVPPLAGRGHARPRRPGARQSSPGPRVAASSGVLRTIQTSPASQLRRSVAPVGLLSRSFRSDRVDGFRSLRGGRAIRGAPPGHPAALGASGRARQGWSRKAGDKRASLDVRTAPSPTRREPVGNPSAGESGSSLGRRGPSLGRSTSRGDDSRRETSRAEPAGQRLRRALGLLVGRPGGDERGEVEPQFPGDES
jgi:hypothetical protein